MRISNVAGEVLWTPIGDHLVRLLANAHIIRILQGRFESLVKRLHDLGRHSFGPDERDRPRGDDVIPCLEEGWNLGKPGGALLRIQGQTPQAPRDYLRLPVRG